MQKYIIKKFLRNNVSTLMQCLHSFYFFYRAVSFYILFIYIYIWKRKNINKKSIIEESTYEFSLGQMYIVKKFTDTKTTKGRKHRAICLFAIDALARCRCPDIDCHRVYAQDPRLPPLPLRKRSFSSHPHTCGRHHVCMTRMLIFTIHSLSLSPPLSDSHTCDPPCMHWCTSCNGEYYYCDSRNNAAPGPAGAGEMQHPLSRTASRYLARARLRDARSYLANQFRPARSENRSLTLPLACCLSPLWRSKLSLPRREKGIIGRRDR